MTPPPPASSEALGIAERHLSRGALTQSRDALLPLLHHKAAQGDPTAALAARLLEAQAQSTLLPTQDALATALDRLLQVVQAQDTQLRALQALLETRL